MKILLKNNLINFVLILYMEFIFGIFMFEYFEKSTIISIFIYSLFISCIITLITNLFNKKVNKIINYFCYAFLAFVFCLQLVFKNFFKTFFCFSLFKLADQVMSFSNDAIKAIASNIIMIIFILIPIIILIIYNIKNKRKDNEESINKYYLLSYILIIPLCYIGYLFFINSYKEESNGVYDLYYNIWDNELNVQKLGVISSFNLDIYRNIFGFETKNTEVTYNEIEDNSIFEYDYNVLELKLEEGIPSNVKNYIDNYSGTKKNEYTSIFEGMNIIYIVAESYSEIAVREDLTPTLYKLTNSGFVFDNFYVPYYLSTIGGEFQALTGLYPDSSILSTWRNGTNDFKYGLGNTFKNINYDVYAYHDNSGYFQDRNKYLKSIGFDKFKACYIGLDINCENWPQSDVEMIEKTVNDYINSDTPFLAYYMTVSGHLEYGYESNSMAKKNWDLVKELDYSNKEKAYLATQIELDRALELLINKLEEVGKLDNTVFVMVGDHYPYGLSMNEINDLSEYERDELFEVNHSSLVLWNSKMKTINVDKVGMPIDIIPTIYNLFGISYDSRLFAGNDLLSNSEGIAFMSNYSWITNNGKYNSVTGTYSGTESEEYINNISNIVKNRINFSKDMIAYNGYKYINN